MIVFLSSGDISSGNVFMRHCSSGVKKACNTLPLLSVTIVGYVNGAGKGKMRFAKKKREKKTAIAIPVLTRRDFALTVLVVTGPGASSVFRFNTQRCKCVFN